MDALAIPRRETRRVLLLAAAVSAAAFLWFFLRGEVLLYGDATARINLARRVFDSLTPGPFQLGGVWLPFPKLLLIPLVYNDWAWRTGALASLPSMAAFVLGALGIFRLVWQELLHAAFTPRAARLAAWTATALYLGNFNLLFLQSTAMSEAISLALLIWAVVWLAGFSRAAAAPRSLLLCALCLALGMLTRYDFWLFAPFFGLWALVSLLTRWQRWDAPHRRSALRAWLGATCIVAAAALLWLGLNQLVYGNPLEFANGPYSAKAIQQRMLAIGQPRHPGDGDLPVAAEVYLRAAYANFSEGLLDELAFYLALAGVVWALFRRRASAAWLLWLPLPFYALSIAYGSVPVYLPGTGNLYNIRYGTALIPALAVAVGWFAANLYEAWLTGRLDRRMRTATAAAAVIIVAASLHQATRQGSVCYREAADAWPAWRVMDERVAAAIHALPPHSRILMAVALQGRAVQQSGRTFRDFIYEDSIAPDTLPITRARGLWNRSLDDPACCADFAIGFAGDPVDAAAQSHHLPVLQVIQSPGWPTATVYAARPPASPSP